MVPSPAQRSAFAVATFLAYAVQTVDAYVPEGEELKLQTPTDYLWAALKVGLAFSPIIAIGAIVIVFIAIDSLNMQRFDNRDIEHGRRIVPSYATIAALEHAQNSPRDCFDHISHVHQICSIIAVLTVNTPKLTVPNAKSSKDNERVFWNFDSRRDEPIKLASEVVHRTHHRHLVARGNQKRKIVDHMVP